MSATETELPFIVEYAKSVRSSCKKCKEKIEKDCLRFGMLIQSQRFDGKMLMWHHINCFFEQKNNLQSIAEIANYNNLRWEDQEKIKKYISEKASTTSSKTDEADPDAPDFLVEYARSSRSTCRNCGEKIKLRMMRIMKRDENSIHQGYGPSFLWHHVDCFAKIKDNLGFHKSADQLPGYEKLSDNDKNTVKESFASQERKRKAEDDGFSPGKIKSIEKTEKILKEQNELLFKMRDQLKGNLSKQHMQKLLVANKQQVVAGENQLLDHLADCMVFGALKKCPECNNDSPSFVHDSYICSSNMSDGTKCQFKTKYPDREEFIVSEDTRNKFPFLKDYKCMVQRRHFPEEEKVENIKNEENLPLKDIKVAIFGKFSIPLDVVKKKLQDLGAVVQHKIDETLALGLSTKKELESGSLKTELTKKFNIPVTSFDFVQSIQNGTSVNDAFNENLISDWGDKMKFTAKLKQAEEM